MTKFSLWLVAMTASASLVAQDKPERSKYWPFEIQVGASFMGYDSNDSLARSTGTSATFSPKAPGFSPSARVSIDPIPLPFGSLLFTAGYRFLNDVSLEYSGRDSLSNLSHEQQFLVGATLRFETSTKFEYGVGLDYRYDWMRAPRKVGSLTQETTWRPWLRANARYMFDKGTNVTPFLGMEAAFALASTEVDPADHFRDYSINSGDYSLGTDGRPHDLPSYTEGHMPVWEVAVVGGIRFGRHGAPRAPKPAAVIAAPVAIEEEKPVEAAVEEKPVEAAVVTDNEEVRRRAEEEARRRAEEEARRLAADAQRTADADRIRAEEEARRRVDEQVMDVEALMIHFATNGSAGTRDDRALARRWAEKYRVVDPGSIVIIGHCDIRGLPEHNQQLSVQRARGLANLLRAEGINVLDNNIIGRSFTQPIVGNEAPEGLAKDRRAEVSINNSKYRVVPSPAMEGRLVVER